MKVKHKPKDSEIKFHDSSDSEAETESFNTSIKLSTNKRLSLPVQETKNKSVANGKRKRESLPFELSQSKRKANSSKIWAERTTLEFTDHGNQTSASSRRSCLMALHIKESTLKDIPSEIKNSTNTSVVIDESDPEEDEKTVAVEQEPSDPEDNYINTQLPSSFIIDDSTSRDTAISEKGLHISQPPSNPQSQSNNFNIQAKGNCENFGTVRNLNEALTRSYIENVSWNTETEPPNSQRKVVLVATTEVRYGTMLVFFLTDNQKCLMFLDLHQKIISKIRSGVEIVFCHDYPPYKVNDVNIFVGISKIKIKDS